jgi:hypothetical protein
MPYKYYQVNIIKIMSTFRSSNLRLMPPQHHERVGKWTHKPRFNLNHKKHLSNAFTHSFIFNIILFRKYKNIFTFLHTQLKPKITITASYLFYCMASRCLDGGHGPRCARRHEALSGAMVASSAGPTKFMRILTMKIARRFDGGDDIYSVYMMCSLSVC